MHDQALLRAGDILFTVLLLLMAGLGVALVWAMGELRVLSFAILAVAMVAPYAYPKRRR